MDQKSEILDRTHFFLKVPGIGWNRELEIGKTGFLDRWGSKYLGRGVLSVGDGEGSGFTQRSRIHFRGELEPTVERMNYIVSRDGLLSTAV